jgi:hypothetical protein
MNQTIDNALGGFMVDASKEGSVACGAESGEIARPSPTNNGGLAGCRQSVKGNTDATNKKGLNSPSSTNPSPETISESDDSPTATPEQRAEYEKNLTQFCAELGMMPGIQYIVEGVSTGGELMARKATPDDTKQLADDVAKVMELERAWRAAPYDEPSYSNFMNATPAMADIIRRYQHLVEMQINAMQQAQEALSNHWFTSDDEDEWNNDDVIAADKRLQELLALTAPLIKETTDEQ